MELASWENKRYPLVYLQTVDASSPIFTSTIAKESWPELKSLRPNEYESLIYTADDGTEFVAYYSNLFATKIESIINIAKTIFLCVVLAISSMGFSKDSQTYILDPMERMMEKIKIIAANPMSAATEEVGVAGVYSFEDTDTKK